MRAFCILFILVLAALLWTCSGETQSKHQKPASQRIQVDTCNSCSLSTFIIPSADSVTPAKIKINKPTAITFFNLLDLIGKYDGEGGDSLPEKLKHDNRQSIYRTIDQNGMYKAFIYPHLDSLGVKVISGNYKDRVLTFDYNNQSYTIDLAYFEETDGVVLFTPGKKPVLWTLENGLKHCTDHDFVRCYFQ
jgi:hypothetical protein